MLTDLLTIMATTAPDSWGKLLPRKENNWDSNTHVRMWDGSWFDSEVRNSGVDMTTL